MSNRLVRRLGLAGVLAVLSITGCRTSNSASVYRSRAAESPSNVTAARIAGTKTAVTKETGVTQVRHVEDESEKNAGKELSPAPDLDAGVSPHPVPPDTELQVGTLAQTYPIDLPTALRLGNAGNLQIALARERIVAGQAVLEGADALWLPNLSAGTTYLMHTGQIQRALGEVFDRQRNSLWVGAGPTLSVDIADALYEPLIARRAVQAETAAAEAATNDMLLRISDEYLDLLAAHAGFEVARETRTHAKELAWLTNEYAKQRVGLRSDAERAETELGGRDQQVILAQERVTVVSTELARLLRLDPQMQLVPLESNVMAIDLISTDEPLPNLVAHALVNRPELFEQQALISAAVQRLKQATYGPLIPSIILGYQAGGFGGGPGAFFGRFSDREDFTAAAVWELRNLGLGDRALRRLRESQLTQTQIKSLQVADKVAADVVAAHQIVVARSRQTDVARKTVESALRSYELNMTRIRRGAGLPIEVLQAIQALDRARYDYLQAVTSYNKAQFRLLTALGNTPVAPTEQSEAPADVLRE